MKNAVLGGASQTRPWHRSAPSDCEEQVALPSVVLEPSATHSQVSRPPKSVRRVEAQHILETEGQRGPRGSISFENKKRK